LGDVNVILSSCLVVFMYLRVIFFYIV